MNERIWDRFLTEQDKEVYVRSGFGATSGFGQRPALLVIDVNYNFCGARREPILESIETFHNSCGEQAWDAIPHIRTLIDKCHEKRVPVIYTTGIIRADGWDAGGWLWKKSRAVEEASTPDRPEFNHDGNDIVDEIAPLPHDILIHKHKASAFFGTPLAAFLNDLHADSLLIVGTTTSGCVRASVIDAFSLNFRVTIVEEGCFDRWEASHAINLYDMHAKYGDVLSINEVLMHLHKLEIDMNLPTGDPL